MRLEPLSVVYRAGTSVSRLAWVFVILSVGGSQMDPGVGVPIAVVVLVGGLALAVGYQIAYYQRFDYELTDDSFDIRSGVLSRVDREIPLRRVQNVDISQNVVQRALGLAEVRLETAGGGETEGQLQYVSDGEARRLQDEIARRKRGTSAAADGTTAEPEPVEEPLFAIGPRELLLMGAVSLDLRLVPVLSVALSLVAPSIARRIDPTFGTDPFTAGSLAFAPLLLVGFYLVAAALSGAIAITNYYGFRLSRSGEELRYERGLLQRFSGTIPLAKVQTVSIAANVLARAIGHARLAVETAGYAPGDGNGSQSAVPFASNAEVYELAQEIEPFGDPEWERPPKRARTRYVVRYTLLATVLLALSFAGNRFGPVAYPWFGAVGLYALVPVAAHLKWRNLGYAIGDEHVLTRAGFWVRTTRVVPYYRVQTVLTQQTVFQRRRDLATLVIDTAGSSGLTGSDASAIDIDATVADSLREDVEERLQGALSVRRSERRRRRRQSLMEEVDSGLGGTPMGDGGRP